MGSARTIEELTASFVDGHARRDPGLLTHLYLASARVMHPGASGGPSSPEEEIEDRMRLGLPMAFRVRDAFEDGWRAHVRLAWSVEGTTADGTELSMSGTSSLDCEKRGNHWYIAIEWVRHDEDEPAGPAAA